MFNVNFEQSTFASKRRQKTKHSKEMLDCMKGVVPRKAVVGFGYDLSWKISLK